MTNRALANQEVVSRLTRAHPHLVGVRTAREAIPFLRTRALLHAGPPVAWHDIAAVREVREGRWYFAYACTEQRTQNSQSTIVPPARLW